WARHPRANRAAVTGSAEPPATVRQLSAPAATTTLFGLLVAAVLGTGLLVYYHLWEAIGVAVLFGLAAVLFWLHPWLIVRRGRLTPQSAGDSPDLAAYLSGLVGEMGLARPPVFQVAVAAHGVGAQAFGRFRRHFVRLDGTDTSAGGHRRAQPNRLMRR